MKRKLKSLIPAYAVLPLISCVVVNFIVYMGVSLIVGDRKHYDFTTAFDRGLPVIPQFVLIYLGCYIFWIVNYVLIVRQGKEHCYRFVTADIMSRLICAMFFLILPTTNIRPVLAGNGVWENLLQFVYDMDAPTRLFPSIHCLVSWFCFIGIRGQKNVPKAYRIFSCVFALLVCISTQFTKQHYVIDIFGGILIAELTYYMAFHTRLYRPLEKKFERVCKSEE